MKRIYSILLALIVTGSFSCTKILDRPPLTELDDTNAWTSETNLRLYANKFYPSFFPGYGEGFSTSGAALMGYQFSDDVLLLGNQSNFGRSVPNSSIWSYSDIRSINIMIDRIETRMKDILTTEAYDHWMGIARFFRAMEYADLVRRYGDVPYYDHVVSDIDMDDLYKPRTPRNEVMDHVFEDLEFAIQNVRPTDGDQYINKYVVAAFASRIALYEGSWQKYYYNDNQRATKFFQQAEQAANTVMTSGRYDIVSEFRTLFTSKTLAGNRDVVFFRHYDPAANILHSAATYNNLSESVAFGPTTDLIKSFIAVDGKAWQNSDVANADDFTLSTMIKTRDPRLEATFYDKPTNKNKASYWYINKFLPRSVAATVEAGGAPPTEWTSNKNESDYPVIRYAEVLLNWVEAKAELGTADQSAIDMSINKIRNRPLAPEAIADGVTKTAPLNLGDLPNDPNRDPGVSPLMWEIRRERRMEFAFEYGRFEDLKRWKKLQYMDTETEKDLLSGGWVNFPTELPSELTSSKVGQISVVKKDGQVVVYNGSNANEMRGFYRDPKTNGRLPFLNQANVNPYLSPVGRVQIEDYKNKGYVLKQTEGWPQD
ncbi:MAG: RagB/SusD family nutrient uptake outer membrane protein [Flavisolibacter sp.]